jgi:molecular chaperone HscC
VGNSVIFGIDLGTTNSLICYLKEGRPTPVANAHGSFLTPSVVSLDGETVLVGQAAKDRLLTHPAVTVASFKRQMGSPHLFRLGKREFRPEELSALVLGSLKADAEAALGEPVAEVVISVPAYFNDQQRKATRLAGELAGLKVLRLINEPTAAALCHGMLDREAETKFLIFDLGGGTFDVSILERFLGVMEVRATGGDTFLGGDDFTSALMTVIADKAGLSAKQREDARTEAALRHVAETCKRALGAEAPPVFKLPEPLPPVTVTVSHEEFEQACAPLLTRLRAPIERALRDARLRAADLDEVVLVGGATRMPMIRRLVAQLFGRLPARHPDPDQTIALGAAVCAGVIGQDSAFEEIVLTDVCPHTLGTSVAVRQGLDSYEGGVFLPIIERNTIVPASRSQQVVTMVDNQKKLVIDVYQGESRRVEQNIKLGEIELEIPPRKAGEIGAEIRFTYDVNGILDVDVDIEAIGLSRNLLIKKLAGDVPDEEIARRREVLASLKIHPRNQDKNKQLIDRANQLFEQLLGEERQLINRVLPRFLDAIERQEPQVIEQARHDLIQVLDHLANRPLW